MEVGCCVEAGGEALEDNQSFLPTSGGASRGSVLALPLAFPFQCLSHALEGVKVSISPCTPPEAYTEEVVHSQGGGAALR